MESQEHRLRDFITDYKDRLHKELKIIDTFIRQYALYRFFNTHINGVKYIIYACVLFLNLNILLSTHEDVVQPGRAFIKLLASDSDIMTKHKLSIVITVVLGLASLVGYLCIAVFLTVRDVPFMLMDMDQQSEKCMRMEGAKSSDFYNSKAFDRKNISFFATFMCIVVYEVNFSTTESAKLFYPLLLLGNVLVLFSCVRNYIEVPQTMSERLYCLLYDVTLTKGFLRNHVIFSILAILGFVHTSFFTLMLMDIMNLSSILFDVLKAISLTADKLSMVGYVMSCLINLITWI